MVNKLSCALCLPTALWIVATTCTAAAVPKPDDLIVAYYSDIGADLLTGEALVLHHTYQPLIAPAKVQPADPKVKDAGAMAKYRRYLSERFDVKLGSGAPEQTWEILRVRYNGAKKRLDRATLTAAQYERALAGKLSLSGLVFSRRFDDGIRMTSIDDQGVMKTDPQATITSFHLGVPDFEHFGRSRCNARESEFMTTLLRSEKFVITGESTAQGYQVTAVSNKSSITRIEALFDLSQGNRIKQVRTFYRRVLMEEELFDDYVTTSSGNLIATKVVRRKFSPIPELATDSKTKKVSLEPVLSLQETYSVLSADFNLDIADSLFVPDIPIGTTVFDKTVSPPKNYRYGVVPDEKKNQFVKKAQPPAPTSVGSRVTFYLTLAGFLAVLGVLVVRVIHGKGEVAR
jgi:hypothetical protein